MEKNRGGGLALLVSVLFLISPFAVIIADRVYEQKFISEKLHEDKRNLARKYLDEIRFSCTSLFQIREILLRFHKELEPMLDLPENAKADFIGKVHGRNCSVLPRHDLFVAVKDGSLKTSPSGRKRPTSTSVWNGKSKGNSQPFYVNFRFSSGIGLTDEAFAAFTTMMDDQHTTDARCASSAIVLGKILKFPFDSKLIRWTQEFSILGRELGGQIFNTVGGEKGLFWYYPEKGVKTRYLVCFLLDLKGFDPNFGIKRILREYADEAFGIAFLPEDGKSAVLSSSFFSRNENWAEFLGRLSRDHGRAGFEGEFRNNFFCMASIPGGLPFRVLVTIPLSIGHGTNFLDLLFYSVVSVMFLSGLMLIVEKSVFDRGPRVKIAMVLMIAFFTVSFVPISLAKIMIRIGLFEKNKSLIHQASLDLRQRLERFDRGFELPGAEFVHRLREAGQNPKLKSILENEKPKERSALQFLYNNSNPPDQDLDQIFILTLAGEKNYKKSFTRSSGFETKDKPLPADKIHLHETMASLISPFLNKLLILWNPGIFTSSGMQGENEKFDADSLKNEMKSDFIEEVLRGILGMEGYFNFISNVEAVGGAKTTYFFVFMTTTQIMISGALRYLTYWAWSDYEQQDRYIPKELKEPKWREKNTELFLARKTEGQGGIYKTSDEHQEAIWKLITRARTVDLPQGSRELEDSEKILLDSIPGKHLNLYFVGGSRSIAPIIEEQKLQQGRFQIFVYGSLLMALFIAWLVNLYFLTPLSRLKKAIDQIDRKNYDDRLDEDREDEFGTIGSAYNVMTKGLREGTLLKQYVSSSVQRIVQDKQAYQNAIVGEKREVTVVFSSLHDFEKIRSKEAPLKAMQMLGKHLSICSSSIRKFGGDIDKVIGEKVMMFFDHKDLGGSREALQAAMLVVNGICEGLKRESMEPAVGVNTGEVIAGIVGAQNVRLDYTVIGDAVNLAARLAAMAHEVQGSRVILSGNSKIYAPEELKFEKLANRTVKGKTQEIEAFLLL